MADGNGFLDKDVTRDQVQSLSNSDALAAFFAHLGYGTEARIKQTPANLGIATQSLKRHIRSVELIADQDGLLQVYLFELKSVTVAATQGIARAFKARAGNYLVVLTSKYEHIDFVLMERSRPKKDDGNAFSQRQATVQPRTLSVSRRKPERRHLHLLRRFTYTESDPILQWDKLRSAYDAAYWSEEYFDNRALFSDYYLLNRLPDDPVWQEDPVRAYRKLRELYADARSKWAAESESNLRKGQRVRESKANGH